MPIRKLRPTTPGQRGAIRPDFSEITKKSPEKALTFGKRRSGGRDSKGRISVRHRGGGHKRLLRKVDFRRDKAGVPGTVYSIEYDPNRAARIVLVVYRDGDKRYHVAPLGLKVGDIVEAGPDAEVRLGNALPLRLIPTGTTVHNIELKPGAGGQMARSAGASARVREHEEQFTTLLLPSGEIRKVLSTCMATIGQVGTVEHKNMKLGKAGRARHMGRRPSVRGSAMSPRDHPHGGGEGRSPIGMKHPKTPWGKPALGSRTRRRRHTDQFIIRRRKK
jgi:large subunit ribosomal protein L2